MDLDFESHPRSKQVQMVVDRIQPLLDDSPDRWWFALAQIDNDGSLPLEVLRKATSDLAWLARTKGHRLPTATDYQACAHEPNPEFARRALAYVASCRLRFDLRFHELRENCQVWLVDFSDDAFIRAHLAFAMLGERSSNGIDLVEEIKTMPSYDRECRATCLHGLWLVPDLPGHAEQIDSLSNDMIGRGEDDANVYYWRAAALRSLGRFDDALVAIDRATTKLPIGANAVHQDYMRERELIGAARQLNQSASSLARELVEDVRADLGRHRAELEREVEVHTAEARKLVSESLLRIVEVLALFVTLAGFLITSGVLAFETDSPAEAAAAIAALALGASGFFALLRVIVRWDGWRDDKRTSRLRNRKN